MRRWAAAAAAVAVGTSAFAQTAPGDAADGGSETASAGSATPYVPAGVVLYGPSGVIVYSPAGIPSYGSAPATPPGDTSTFSSAGPTVGRGPTVGPGPEVTAGTPIGDAGP